MAVSRAFEMEKLYTQYTKNGDVSWRYGAPESSPKNLTFFWLFYDFDILHARKTSKPAPLRKPGISPSPLEVDFLYLGTELDAEITIYQWHNAPKTHQYRWIEITTPHSDSELARFLNARNENKSRQSDKMCSSDYIIS